MRLDKFLSKALNVSRKDAKAYINKGRVNVNDERVFQCDFHINDEDQIFYNNKLIKYQEYVYYMLNKPSGVVSAVVDPKDKTVIDLIKERSDVFPVGRLDKDTEGLMIITNDGNFAHLINSPKHKVIKKYYVVLENDIKSSDIKLFSQGFKITDGRKNIFTTQPALLEPINNNTCYVFISEGKFHQIKKMFIKINNKVVYLKRIAIGKLKLDESLKPGDYRELSNEEINLLKA